MNTILKHAFIVGAALLWPSIGHAQSLFTRVDITSQCFTGTIHQLRKCADTSNPRSRDVSVQQCDQQQWVETNGNFWTLYPAAGPCKWVGVYGEEGPMRAEIVWWDFTVSIDPTKYTNNPIVSAELDWMQVKVGASAPDYTYRPVAFFNESRAIPVNQQTSISRSFHPAISWPDRGGVRYYVREDNSYYGERQPRVYGLVQNYEVKPDNTNPDPTLANVGEPINTINGNVSLPAPDITIPAPGIPLVFGRMYNSVLDYTGPLGPRWTHSFNWLVTDTNSVFGSTTNVWKVLQTGDGEKQSFRRNANGTYSSPLGLNWQLSTNGGKPIVTFPGQMRMTFSTDGKMETFADAWSNRVSCTYSNGAYGKLLTRLDHSNGQYLTLSYSNAVLVRVNTPNTNLYVTFAYNTLNELCRVEKKCSASSFPTTYAYDYTPSWQNHSLTQKVNAVGDVFAWEYVTNGLGQVTSQGRRSLVGANWYDTAIAYSNAMNESIVVSGRGDTNITMVYDYHPILKRITEVRDGNISQSNWCVQGTGVKYLYNDAGNITNSWTFDNSNGFYRTMSLQYDGCQNVTNIGAGVNANPSNFWSSTWDTNVNLLTSMTDPSGAKVSLVYTNGSVVKTRIQVGTGTFDTVTSYYSNGVPSTVTNANGHWTSFGQDSRGYINRITPQVGPEVTFSNNTLGAVERIAMPWKSGKRETVIDQNELGWVSKISYPDGSFETFRSDALGNVTNHIDAGGRSAWFSWLPTRKLASVVRDVGDGSRVTNSLTYDKQFNTVRYTDVLGRRIESYVLDSQDRPVIVTNLEGQTMTVQWGLDNLPLTVSRFDGSVVSNQFDTDGRVVKTFCPGITNAFSYYRNNLLRTASNNVGVVSNGFDTLNRLVETKGVAPFSTVQYGYYPAGQVSNAVSVVGTNVWKLDGADRVSEIATKEGTFTLTYNADSGLPSSMVCTNTGLQVTYGFDILDRMTNATWTRNGTLLNRFAYEYNVTGVIQRAETSRGYSTYRYDGLDRLTGVKRYTSRGVLTDDETFTYDLPGNRKSKNWNGITVNYALPYGNQGDRMTGWNVTQSLSTVTLQVAGTANETIGTNPLFGRLWISNSVGGAVTPSVDGMNWWHDTVPVGLGTQKVVVAIPDLAGNTTVVTNDMFLTVITNAVFQYSAAGCVTSIVELAKQWSRTRTFAWNRQYQLTEARTNGVIAEQYGYDSLGQRAYTVTGNVTNWFVYDGAHVIADLDGTGKVVRSYTYAPGIDRILAMTVYTGTTVKTYFYITDLLGSVHGLVDTSGNFIEQYEFDAWGKVLSVTDGNGRSLVESTIGNRYLWTGREYSWKSGLYYVRARWYTPEVGRWCSVDPIGIAGGMNLWEYCANRPVDRFDPTGHGMMTPGPNFGGGDGFSLNVPQGVYLNSAVNTVTAGLNEFNGNPYGVFDFSSDTALLTSYTVGGGRVLGGLYNAGRRLLPVVITTGAIITTQANNAFYRFSVWQPGRVIDPFVLYYPQTPVTHATITELSNVATPYLLQFASGYWPGDGFYNAPWYTLGQWSSWTTGQMLSYYSQPCD